uniref:BACON domain-containing protein n=1 Tax=Alistipes megaguti TaxID=2364787 RepID=UPI0013CE5776|nr:BACON domain-containing protein [Alistipes megaguti]
MKKVNLWKTLFLSALAVAAFTGCSDDDSDEGGGMPSITVNGQSTATLSIGLAGGTTEAVTIESSGDWTMTVTGENGADASACTPSLSSGSKGTKTVTFDLTEAATPRTYTVKVTTSGTIPGIGVATDVSATIKIEQTDSYVPTTDALYSENCGTTVEKDGTYWPYADAFTGWTRGGTLDQAGVTYGGNKASVRNSGKDYDPTDDEKAEVSGYPYAYINGSQGLDISNINVGSNSNFTFTFTALNTVSTLEASPYTPTFGDVTASTLKFSVNPDGTAWMPVEITTKKLGTGSWYLCTAMFKLPAGVSTDKISVRFDSYSGGASLRLDDFKLYEGGDGTELAPEVPTSGTISQITEPGTYELSNVTVVNRSDIATIVADATGYMMIYGDNELKVGDKVNVAGPVTIYKTNPLQFSTSTTTTLEVVSSDNSWNYTFTEYSVEDVRSYFNDIKCIPIQLAGTIVKDGTFYNLMFDGESNLQGSIQYYTPEASVLDVPVLVKGYAVGQSESGSIERIKIFPYEITVNSTTPYITATAPATFSADGETIEVSYTAGNLGSNQVFAKLENNEAGQFSVGEVADDKVSVTAKANEGAACQATLVLYIAASEGGEALAQTSVTLKQSAPAVAGSKWVKVTEAPADWSGEYLIVYEEGNLIFDGSLDKLDVEGNIKSVEISDNTIASDATVDACKFTITSVEGGYSIMSASGYYIYQNANSNGMSSSATTAGVNTIALNSDNSVQISGSQNAVLRYNNAEKNGTRFRYYKASSYQNQQPIALYKYTAE